MANPFNIGIFNGPRYSSFPWSHDNKISMSAGRLTPIAWEFLNTGDRIEADVANVVRLAPMVAPTLDTYRVDVHAFALRLRSLGNATRNPWAYEDFFNLNKNQDGSLSLPMIPLSILFAVNGFKNGTLIESLGFPTFKKDRDAYLEFLRRTSPFVFDPIVSSNPSLDLLDDSVGNHYYFALPLSYPFVSPPDSNGLVEISNPEVTSYEVGGNGYRNNYSQGEISMSVPFRGTLISYIAQTYPEVFHPDSPTQTSPLGYFLGITQSASPSEVVTAGVIAEYRERLAGMNVLDRVYELYKVDSISVMKDFEDWLLDGLLELTISGNHETSSSSYALYGYSSDSFFRLLLSVLVASFPDLPSVYIPSYDGNFKSIPIYPFDAYYKIISDWYINTALTDPDTFFAARSFSSILNNSDLTRGERLAALREQNELFKRFWANDYFTSAFPSPQAGQAVGIPVNGTIVDLRNANAMQKLKERLLYAGSRFRDVLFAITGKHTSSAILEMSEVLGSWSNIINVDSVLQQSETTNGNPQAGYAGTGLGYRAGGKDFRYTAEEPTVIFVFASIVPIASYFQGLSRKFTRANVYDYAIPQLANVGEQRIMRGELYLGSDSPSSDDVDVQTFGFTRRNGDFMWTPSEVHGDFRGSLDYWHNARIFGSSPSLSQNFLQVNPTDDNLNRVFAVQSDSYDHFYCNFSFTGHVVRSLPKHVHYDL